MKKVWIENGDGTITFSNTSGQLYEIDFQRVLEFKLERRGRESLERCVVRVMREDGSSQYLKCGGDEELASRILTHLRDNTSAREV